MLLQRRPANYQTALKHQSSTQHTAKRAIELADCLLIFIQHQYPRTDVSFISKIR